MNFPQQAGRQLAPWIVPLLLVVGWQWAANRGHDSASSPSAVLAAGWRLTRSHELPTHLWESSKRALVGLAIGGSLGLALGICPSEPTGFSRARNRRDFIALKGQALGQLLSRPSVSSAERPPYA